MIVDYKFIKETFASPYDSNGNPLDGNHEEVTMYSLYADRNHVFGKFFNRSDLMTEELQRIRANVLNKSNLELYGLITGMVNLFNKMADDDVNKHPIEMKIIVLFDVLFEGCDRNRISCQF